MVHHLVRLSGLRAERLCVDPFPSVPRLWHSVVTIVTNLDGRHVGVHVTTRQQVGCADGAVHVVAGRVVDLVEGLREDLVERDTRHALVVSRPDRRRLVVGVDSVSHRGRVHAMDVHRVVVDDRRNCKHTTIPYS